VGNQLRNRYEKLRALKGVRPAVNNLCDPGGERAFVFVIIEVRLALRRYSAVWELLGGLRRLIVCIWEVHIMARHVRINEFSAN